MPFKPPKHTPPNHKTAAEHRAAFDKERPNASQRGYGYQWQKARQSYLIENPLCVHCRKDGLAIAATVVDHIIPHKGNQQLFWDRDNWQSLCKRCHDKKTASEDGGFGRS